MSLISKIFGEWVVVRSGAATVDFISPLSNKEWEEDVGVTLERHSRTMKERAFIHRLDGTKQPTSVDVVKSFIGEKTK